MTGERETATAINDAAADWVARIDRAPEDVAIRAELERWMASDPRRRGAYFRARSAWQMLDRANVLKSGAPHEGENRTRIGRRQVLIGGGMAASVVIVATGGALLRERHDGKTRVEVETAVGEIRRLPLADGSMTDINTDTQMAVTLRPRLRSITLDRGEAFFQVAHDRNRPFVVAAGDVRVEAVGTAFSVRRTDAGAEVQVVEGKVAVWSVNAAADRRLMNAGSRALVVAATGSSEVAAAPKKIQQNLAWMSGQLVFDGDTLEAGAAEFNRYNHVRIEIGDAALAGERLVGRFHTNDPEAFADAAAGMFGARVARDRDVIQIVRR